MLAKNSVLEDTLPSISTDTMVLARSISRALTSFCSSARFHAFSSPRILPPSSLSVDCRAALKTTPNRIKLTVTIAHFMELILRLVRLSRRGRSLRIVHGRKPPQKFSQRGYSVCKGRGGAKAMDKRPISDRGLPHSKLAALGEEFADRTKGLIDRGVGVVAR